VIDRCADILERAGADVDAVSSQIFEPSAEKGHARSYSQILLTIGKKGTSRQRSAKASSPSAG
jgi:magnesium transporter